MMQQPAIDGPSESVNHAAAVADGAGSSHALVRPPYSTAGIPKPAQRRRATTQRATFAERAGVATERGAEASPARQWHAHQMRMEQQQQAKAKQKQLQEQQQQQPQEPQQHQAQPQPQQLTSAPSSSFGPSVAAAASHAASSAFGLFSHLSTQLGSLISKGQDSLIPRTHPKHSLNSAAIMQQQLRTQQPQPQISMENRRDRQRRREASREHAVATAAALRHANATDSEAFSSGNQTEIEESEDEEKEKAEARLNSPSPLAAAALAWAPDSPSGSVQQLSQSGSSLPQAPCQFADFGCESLVHAERGSEDPHYASAANHHISLLQLKFALIVSQRNQLQQTVEEQYDALQVADEHSIDLESRLRVQTNKLQQARSKISRQKAVMEEVQALRVQNVQDLVSSYAGQPPVHAKSMLRSQRKQVEALRAQLTAKDALLRDVAGLLRYTRLGPHILARMHAAENPTPSPKVAAGAVAAAKKKEQPQKQKQGPQQQKSDALSVLPSSSSPTLFGSIVAAAARRPPALALPAPVPAPKLKPQQAVSALAQRKLLEKSSPSSVRMRSLVASLTADPATQTAGQQHMSPGKENATNPSPQPPQKQSQQQQQASRVFGPSAPTPQQQQEQQQAASRSSRRKLRRSLLSASAEDDCPIPLLSEAELMALLPKDGSRVPRPMFMPDPDRPVVDNSQLPWEDYDGPYVHPHKQLRTMIESTEFLRYSAADDRLYAVPAAETEEDDRDGGEEQAAPFTLARNFRKAAANDDEDDEEDDDDDSPAPRRPSIRELPARMARSVGAHFLCPVVAKKKISTYFTPRAQGNEGGSESEENERR